MSGSSLDDFTRELGAVGIRGQLRRRILVELIDHLECDPGADLGDPALIAAQFADAVGTQRTRRAVGASFGALAVAGLVFAVAVLARFFGSRHSAQADGIRMPLILLAAIAAQVAFVSGGLALVRWFWHRRDAVLPRAEATVIVRRAGVGVGAALVAIGALAALALGYHRHVNGWPEAVVIAAAAAAGCLIASLPVVGAAAQVRPTAEGAPGDLFADIGMFVPPPLRRPWRFARVVAGALALALVAQGLVASDPFDGMLTAVAEAGSCLAGFAALGPFLGLYEQHAAFSR